jgi:uncharacterized protein
MSLFAIADLHLSLGADKPMDVFSGWEGYLDKLKANWLRVVGGDDTVVIPGDVSWAMSLPDTAADFAFLDSLPGKKVILKGNHDYWWCTMKKMEQYLRDRSFASLKILHNSAVTVGGVAVCGTRGWFYDEAANGDQKVLLREAGRLEASIAAAEKTGLEPVVFLHYPPVYSDFFCAEIVEVLQRHQIRRCYYGHLHGRSVASAVQGQVEGIDFRLVSADSLHFTPLLIE